MSKKSCAFNENNLAVMGLYDTVYDMYVNLQNFYNSAIKQLDTSTISFPDKADAACRNQVRQVLEAFLTGYTNFFTRDYEKLHITAYSLHGFSMLKTEHGAKPLQVSVSDITFHSFLNELLMVVVRTMAQQKNRQYPGNELDGVFEEVNQYIDSLAMQYRKRIPVTAENTKCQESRNLFVFSQFSLISCNQKQHSVVPDTFLAEKLDGSGFYNLPIHRCITCGRQFVGKYTLDYYQRAYGKIRVTTQRDQISKDRNTFQDWNLESDLHKAGYNVVEGLLSEANRRSILIQLLKSGKMTYFEISRDIKNAISIQQHLPSRASAIAKWKSDLAFLSKYIEEHPELR